jgi:hypothetical protein
MKISISHIRKALQKYNDELLLVGAIATANPNKTSKNYKGNFFVYEAGGVKLIPWRRKDKAYHCYIPGMIYNVHVSSGSWHSTHLRNIVVVKEEPSTNTATYKLPLPNIYGTGFCMGSGIDDDVDLSCATSMSDIVARNILSAIQPFWLRGFNDDGDQMSKTKLWKEAKKASDKSRTTKRNALEWWSTLSSEEVSKTIFADNVAKYKIFKADDKRITDLARNWANTDPTGLVKSGLVVVNPANRYYDYRTESFLTRYDYV